METCKTCKFWAGKIGGFEMPYTNFEGGRFREMYGRCEHEKVRELPITLQMGNDAIPEKYLDCATAKEVTASGAPYLSSIYTGPNFGCVHHSKP